MQAERRCLETRIPTQSSLATMSGPSSTGIHTVGARTSRTLEPCHHRLRNGVIHHWCCDDLATAPGLPVGVFSRLWFRSQHLGDCCSTVLGTGAPVLRLYLGGRDQSEVDVRNDSNLSMGLLHPNCCIIDEGRYAAKIWLEHGGKERGGSSGQCYALGFWLEIGHLPQSAVTFKNTPGSNIPSRRGPGGARFDAGSGRIP